MGEYDPVCHCGTSLSQHSMYDNHSFTEMDTWESMDAKITGLRAECAMLREALIQWSIAVRRIPCPPGPGGNSLTDYSHESEPCGCWKCELIQATTSALCTPGSDWIAKRDAETRRKALKEAAERAERNAEIDGNMTLTASELRAMALEDRNA